MEGRKMNLQHLATRNENTALETSKLVIQQSLSPVLRIVIQLTVRIAQGPQDVVPHLIIASRNRQKKELRAFDFTTMISQ